MSADASLPSHPYPADQSSSFYWRTGAAFADFTGNGYTDLVTMGTGEVHGDVVKRHATLFGQFPRADGGRALRNESEFRISASSSDLRSRTRTEHNAHNRIPNTTQWAHMVERIQTQTRDPNTFKFERRTQTRTRTCVH